jgi:adenine-specific DNA-methyltransferase
MQLIKASPNSDDIIRPILRGKHIKKYGELNLKEWIIIIPCGWTNSHRGNKDPEPYFMETYPAIYKHFKEKADQESKGKGLYNRDDQGNYWWELRPCDYIDEFDRPKIKLDIGSNLINPKSFGKELDLCLGSLMMIQMHFA